MAQQPGPHDLVWVEGQSVAWLRPSEIPALRNTIQEPLPQLVKADPVAEIEAGQQDQAVFVELPKTEPVESVETPKTNVFVSIPEEMKKYVPLEKVAPVPVVSPVMEEEKEIPKTKFERPLDDIKEMYVKTLEDRKKRTARKKRLAKQVRYAVIILALIGIGAAAGMGIQKWKGKSSTEKEAIIPVQTKQEVVQPENSNPAEQVNNSLQDLTTTENSGQNSAEESIADRPALSQKEMPVSAREKSIPEQVNQDDVNKSIHIDKSPEQKNESEKKVIPSRAEIDAISAKVALKANQYKTGTFGGIRDLQLTLTNESAYALEKVTVELQYLKLGDEVVKSEFVQFRAVPANGTQTIDIPSSKRGIKVIYKIRNIDPEPKANVAGF